MNISIRVSVAQVHNIIMDIDVNVCSDINYIRAKQNEAKEIVAKMLNCNPESLIIQDAEINCLIELTK